MDGGFLLIVILGVVELLAVAVLIRSFAGTRHREKAGYGAGFGVWLAMGGVRAVSDDRNWPWRVLVIALAVAVAIDALSQVRRLRPAPGQGATAVAGWACGAFVLPAFVVAVYVARRVMHLPVIPGTRVSR